MVAIAPAPVAATVVAVSTAVVAVSATMVAAIVVALMAAAVVVAALGEGRRRSQRHSAQGGHGRNEGFHLLAPWASCADGPSQPAASFAPAERRLNQS
jgi:hypothetical protein